MRVKPVWFAVLLGVLAAATAHAQTRLTGTILGRAIDAGGLAVPGVTITVAGPALIQPETVVTNDRGEYRAINLPPGPYALTAEVSGFQTVKMENLQVSVGADVEINLKMNPSQVAETVTVSAPSPVVDVQQTKNTQTITKEALNAIPLSRDIISAVQLAPGVVERTVQGSARNDTAYLIDGINVNAPDQAYAEANINWDTIEEMEFITTANPVENYGVVGGALNIVTKSGGNLFKGQSQYYFTNKSLAKQILPAEALSALKIGAAAVPQYDRDFSATVGGPVKRDRTWFLGSYRYVGQEVLGSFIPTTILGTQYTNYNAPYRQDWGFGKVTTQLAPSLRFFTSYNYTKGDRPHDFSVPAFRTVDATRHWMSTEHTLSSNLTWVTGPKLFVDTRFGLYNFHYHGLAQPGTEENPAFSDDFSGYTFGRLPLPDATVKKIYEGSVKASRYVDNWGGSHEFKAGFETQYSYGSYIFWTPNSMSWHIYDNNPYYYRGLYDLNAPDPVFGDGFLSFTTASTSEGGSLQAGDTIRYGGFLQDNWHATDRITINAGLRYDLTRGNVPGFTKQPADALAQAIGAAYFQPAYGLNPFGALEYSGWNNPIPWKGFSPAVGLAWDVFGNGKTAVKVNWAQYQERLPTWHFDSNTPSGGADFAFNWFDLNGNGVPDPPGTDRYEQADNSSPLGLVGDTWKQGIDPNLKTPHLDEFTTGIEHQVANDLRLGVTYVFRSRKNLMSDPPYDLTTGQYWGDAASGFWVPFTTTVPAFANYPAETLTLYYQKANAPELFTRLTNISDATAKYQGLDITLNKRMSHGWQMGTSLVLSKDYGTFPLNSGFTYGMFQSPNYLVNRDGRLPFDRPVQVKLWGSATLPYQVVGSLFYRFASGTPYNRTISVVPPAAWAAQNGVLTFGQTVNVEPNGDRRNQSMSNLDARLEKVFKLPRGQQASVFVDAFNVLGFAYVTVQANPRGTWRPADVNSAQGTFSPASTGLTGQTGTRIVKFSIRYTF